ncbi:MAG: hypothetical protein R3E50_15965 [Halioglobus sp.]
MLFGYPSSLAFIMDYARQHDMRLDDLGIAVAFVTSERLYDHQRESIRSGFGCPVANGYGGRDAGFIAHQCPAGAMHITAEDIVVEIVDAAGEPLPDGEKGDSGHPSSHRRFSVCALPHRDIGALAREPCGCGRGLPVLAEIEGRTTDFVRAMDGTVLHGLALIYVLRDIPEVEGFKIIQESLDTVTVLVVSNDGPRAAIEQLVREQFRRRLGAEDDDKLRLPAGHRSGAPSGKFRYVVSRLDDPEGEATCVISS